jgi:hypothetical protein
MISEAYPQKYPLDDGDLLATDLLWDLYWNADWPEGDDDTEETFWAATVVANAAGHISKCSDPWPREPSVPE